ncbi:alpha/beta hydrolase [Ectothiorhodospira mobilis]|nr:alpha/beta fold hydrolase [Ectothiorhodospira mobilis]MBK1692796.1 alpha/beta hydrolase [Ectothiorhodospira mobilis]
MRILFLHGWQSRPGGVKPTFLQAQGHRVLNPALDDDDFDAALATARTALAAGGLDVVVGSSRGGALAMNLDTGGIPRVLLCPAWRLWGKADRVPPGSVILHSPRDEVIPFEDSRTLVAGSGLAPSALWAVGEDHRLADAASLEAMHRACLQVAAGETP